MANAFGDMIRRARKDAQDGDWAPSPGNHDAVVVEGDAFESKVGDVYAKTTLKLATPGDPDAGRTWDHLMGFRSPQQQAMTVGQLSVYGISDADLDNLEDIDDLARAMGELVGRQVEVTCKAKDRGDGVWTNITGSRGPNGSSDVPPDLTDFKQPVAAKPDDDIPF